MAMKSPALRYFPDIVINPASEQVAMGRALRQRLPRSSHAEWTAGSDRPDPITLLRMTDHNRLPSLVPIRYGRMLTGPADFLRGAAVVMAHDLSGTPVTGLKVQLCGDAHLGNFGGFATPERHLIFDINDFDETIGGPWEWDLKRLAASTMVCGRQNGLSNDACRQAVLSAAERYRQHMRTFGEMRFLDTWYTSINAEDVVQRLSAPGAHKALNVKAPHKTNVGTLSKLVESVDRGYRIANDPPLITHRTYPLPQRISEVWSSYRSSLSEDHRLLLDRYHLVDIARKVVGIGSVGLRCFIALLLGSDDEDPLFLQFKEARLSVFEPFGPTSIYANQGKRVASGQRIMQAASDIFLGWTHCGAVDYYVRQLRDMKFSVPVEELDADDLAEYASLCSWALARAHACSGDPARIGGYLGSGDVFDQALASFATSYADQTERDHAALVKAVKNGRIPAETSI
jgi:uncharacterized protein (DUF2252 family)